MNQTITVVKIFLQTLSERFPVQASGKFPSSRDTLKQRFTIPPELNKFPNGCKRFKLNKLLIPF